MRIGVQLWPGGTPDYRTWRQAVLDAEELGADAIFGYDHFHKPFLDIVDRAPQLQDEQPEVNNFEAWTALASWGEITTRAEIGLLVSGMPYRNPDLIADMARTVDHISGGRLILGLGAGWYPKDFIVYGYEYGTVRSRMDHFDEGLKRIDYRLNHLTPGPVRQVPILILGGGERRTIPAAARHAHIWHSFEPIAEFRRKNDLLKRLGPMAVAILLLVAGFRMPGYIASAMAVPLFKHQGFTNTDIATVTKVFGFWIALGGAFAAGWLIPRIGMMSSLLIGTLAGSASHLALALLAAHGGDGGKAFWTFALAVSVEGFAYAFASIVLITYMSTLASVEHAASQFGLLTSLCAFPGSILAGFSGFVIEHTGFVWFFIWTSLIGIPVALLAVFVWYRVGISDEAPIQVGGGH